MPLKCEQINKNTQLFINRNWSLTNIINSPIDFFHIKSPISNKIIISHNTSYWWNLWRQSFLKIYKYMNKHPYSLMAKLRSSKPLFSVRIGVGVPKNNMYLEMKIDTYFFFIFLSILWEIIVYYNILKSRRYIIRWNN